MFIFLPGNRRRYASRTGWARLSARHHRLSRPFIRVLGSFIGSPVMGRFRLRRPVWRGSGGTSKDRRSITMSAHSRMNFGICSESTRSNGMNGMFGIEDVRRELSVRSPSATRRAMAPVPRDPPERVTGLTIRSRFGDPEWTLLAVLPEGGRRRRGRRGLRVWIGGA